jgi:hypothetical protein
LQLWLSGLNGVFDRYYEAWQISLQPRPKKSKIRDKRLKGAMGWGQMAGKWGFSGHKKGSAPDGAKPFSITGWVL